jgi:hypothetical protein
VAYLVPPAGGDADMAFAGSSQSRQRATSFVQLEGLHGDDKLHAYLPFPAPAVTTRGPNHRPSDESFSSKLIKIYAILCEADEH